MGVVAVEINHQALYPSLIFDKEIRYNDQITLYPVKVKNIIQFQECQQAITLRKDAIFHEKELIRMPYFSFIKHAYRDFELAQKYGILFLPIYYDFILRLLQIVCGDDSTITYDENSLDVFLNGQLITDEIFDDLREIIIIQNEIDFDMNEFMNIDTVKALEHAREFEAKKNGDKVDIEDYIDSLVIALNVTDEYVSSLSIRKFWRYIKRVNKYDEYRSLHSAEMTGMVTFKEPLHHWMTSINIQDKYKELKADETKVRGIAG